jgi:hypothetical protein
MRKRLAAVLVAVVLATTGFFASGATAHAGSVQQTYPQYQSGTVHSYTTGRNANVTTTNGGYIWCYNGNCNGTPNQSYPQHQTGQVHSLTTGLYAAVTTNDWGIQWDYNG